MLTLRQGWLIWGFSSGCDKAHWQGCARKSICDAAMLLASGIANCSAGLKQLREERT